MAAGRGMLPNAFAALGDMQSPVTGLHIGHISSPYGFKRSSRSPGSKLFVTPFIYAPFSENFRESNSF